MAKCFFCGKEEKDFKGTHLIRNDGTISYFCSSKCRSNTLNLKRDKKKIRWAEAFHITRDKARAKAKEAAAKESEVKKESKVEKPAKKKKSSKK